MSIYRLPINGNETNDQKKYFKEYDRINEAIKKATGFEITGFGPGISAVKNGIIVRLPDSFAVAIMKYVEEQSND